VNRAGGAGSESALASGRNEVERAERGERSRRRKGTKEKNKGIGEGETLERLKQS
jgi:hypothetical protein